MSHPTKAHRPIVSNSRPALNSLLAGRPVLTAAPVVLFFLLAACAGDGSSEDLAQGAGTPEAEVSLSDAPDTVEVPIETAEAIEAFFEELEYDSAHWQAGVREVPRMYVTEITPRWGERARDDLSVQSKKRIFFRAMAPLALRSNEIIRIERQELLGLPDGASMSDDQREWVAQLAADHGLEAPSGDEASSPDARHTLKDALALRVDEVPVSLVLAQAANESGWGTSRFASEGNALFGQWSFGGSGMLPEEQRASLGNYRVAAFESPLLSVMAYMRNLNTHRAYQRLRELRAEARAAGEDPTGYDLAAGLDRYSERGQDYVDELRSMIDYNGLAPTDETYLAEGPVYLLRPVDPEG